MPPFGPNVSKLAERGDVARLVKIAVDPVNPSPIRPRTRRVRRWNQANRVLSRLTDARVVPLLLEALADPRTEEMAAYAIVERSRGGMPDVRPEHLVAILRSDRLRKGDPIPSGAFGAALAIVPFADPEADRLAVEVLAGVDHRSSTSRDQARDAMRSMGLERLRRALDETGISNRATLAVLAELGDPAAAAEVRQQEEEKSGRIKAAEEEARVRAFERAGASQRRARDALDGADITQLIEAFTGHDPDRILVAGEALAARGAAVLEPLLTAVDSGMLERFRLTAPWRDDEAKLLIMELTGRQMRRAEGDRPLAD